MSVPCSCVRDSSPRPDADRHGVECVCDHAIHRLPSLSHFVGPETVQIRGNLAAKTPQRICRADEVAMGNSSADKLRLAHKETGRSTHSNPPRELPIDCLLFRVMQEPC